VGEQNIVCSPFLSPSPENFPFCLVHQEPALASGGSHQNLRYNRKPEVTGIAKTA